MQLQKGTQVGPYKIVSLLGTGGMGAVHLATDTRLDRNVAVKVLSKDPERSKDALARFEKEAKAVAALSHPNILSIFDVGVYQELPYIVTEYLQGETLRDRLARGPLPWRKAVEIGAAIADGLASAHAKGIIHRDLKPENIFLTTEEHVKILDFGLARFIATTPAKDLSAIQTATRTEAGIVMGTMPYMSPEQAKGEAVDSRSDLYSFGCVLQEMITGRRVFSRPSSAETIAAILKEDPPRVSESVPVPVELDELIARCLEKNPDRRFQSARDLSFELKQILTASASSASYPFTAKTEMRKVKKLQRIALVAFVLIALAVTVFLYFKSPDSTTSIAVLPFVNEDADPDGDYFSDGITESLINNLSRLPQLRVIARTSVFRYKGKQTDPIRAGQELRVKSVLTGRVMQHGDNLIVQADLLDVESGSQLWGERFNREFSDVFAIQEGISREISDKLQLKLTQQQEQRLQKRQTANVEAYQSYLRGRYYWNKRVPAQVQKGFQYMQQAIEKDPGYAEAYVGLAESYAIMSQWLLPADVMPKARAAASKALQIDSDLGEAYATLAFVKAYYEWDWAGAEREFEKAIRLNPNYATARQWYALVLTALGRFDESRAQFTRALEIDPLSLIINSAPAMMHLFSGNLNQARITAEKVLEMDPDFISALTVLVSIYELSGQAQKAMEMRIRVFRTFGDLQLAEQIEKELRTNGPDSAARKIIEIWEREPRAYTPPWLYALHYLRINDNEKALEWLQKSYDRRDTEVIFVNVNPTLDPLRDDPRFQKMLAGMNFPKGK